MKKKHKGLLLVEPNKEIAKLYLEKAKRNLESCEIFKEKRLDYMIPEQWFYTLYHCAQAILATIGVESRSQRCTALFLQFLYDNQKIVINEEMIKRLTVYRDKEEESDVDQREKARYSPLIKSDEIIARYTIMNNFCKKSIAETQDIIFVDNEKIKVIREELV